MFMFGAGFLFAVPLTTIGNNATNPTGQQFGTLQDVSFEITQTLKELRGFNKFPDDVAPGTMKGSGKAMFGRLDLNLFNQLLFAETGAGGVAGGLSSGVTVIQANELKTVPGVGPFTVVVNNAANIIQESGVVYNSGPLAGKRLINSGTNPPLVGQYQVALTGGSKGTYTFNAADANIIMAISYEWTNAAAGQTLTAINHIMGYGPAVEVYLSQPYQGTNGIHLYAVRFAKLGAPLKREDYQIGEMDFEIFANPAGQVIDFFQVSP